MTVKELIERLQQMPQEHEVWHRLDDTADEVEAATVGLRWDKREVVWLE